MHRANVAKADAHPWLRHQRRHKGAMDAALKCTRLYFSMIELMRS